MLKWLSQYSNIFEPLNLFRYITFRTGGATATALFFVFFFGPRIIAALRLKQGKGQPIRDDGPQSHVLMKTGTPTMGGLMILSGLIVSTVLWADLRNHYVWIVLLVMTGFGAIGFYDDLLKVTKQTHKGFSGRRRLASGELAVVCGALIGAGLGFLWFNAPPAQIFMGDTGSLALGGALGTIAVAVKHEIVLAIVGGLFVVETLSVIVQVASFKLTGKRVFKMAPIHHHFEQLGWSEPQVVVRFWIIAFVLALIGLSTLKLR